MPMSMAMMSKNASTSPVKASRERGFTLVELMVTIALFAILLLIAVPAFTQWVRNNQMRSVADSLQNGLRAAKAKAASTNRVVVFFTTNALPAFGGPAVANGLNWGIQTLPIVPAGDANHPQFVEGGRFGSQVIGMTVTGGPALCFNPSGRLVANAAPGVGAAACALPAGPGPTLFTLSRSGAVVGKDRSFGVEVSLSGQIRMCDVDRTLSATTPDGCTP